MGYRSNLSPCWETRERVLSHTYSSPQSLSCFQLWLCIFEPGCLRVKTQLYLTCRTITMFGYNDISLIFFIGLYPYVMSFFPFIFSEIHCITRDKENHISILLDTA